jgi:hypothetical protein
MSPSANYIFAIPDTLPFEKLPYTIDPSAQEIFPLPSI